jgi:hypothetical protein
VAKLLHDDDDYDDDDDNNDRMLWLPLVTAASQPVSQDEQRCTELTAVQSH